MTMRTFGMGQSPAPHGSVLAFLTVDEDEYADVFRSLGWSEHAVEMEVDMLRKLKQEHKELLAPLRDEDEAPNDDDLDMTAVLERSRARRANMSKD